MLPVQPLSNNPLPNAPLWRRIAALVYDAFLLFGLLMLFGYTAVGLESLLLGVEHVEKSPTAGGNPLVFVGMLIVICAFYSVFWLRNKQTLGMQAWRLQIETVDGSPLTLKHGLLRLTYGLLSWSCVGLGYLWCLLPAHMTWHDRLSGTRIVVHEKR
ncbi:MAG TPA: RDD family protein [Pseudomonadales bacterium]|nr:RDD family protein [Pseudomonadales bacterium]